tara:strand:- start:20137 stop:21399 length:1263 start_codon:yes stop_codon:yes gene_type:complete
MDLNIPDIGDFKDVPVIEISVAVGDFISLDDTVIVLESDKATLDVPAEAAGTVVEILVAEGDHVSMGMPMLRIEPTEVADEPPAAPAPEPTPTSARPPASPEKGVPAPPTSPVPDPTAPVDTGGAARSHASPSVRRLARELGVALAGVSGTGRKGRITRDDLHAHVREALSAPRGHSTASDLPAWPQVDYAKFGEVERVDLSRIARISGPALARNAMVIPHVTNFDEADVTDLDAFRQDANADGREIKLSLLPFAVKAAAATLKSFPRFNSSLDGSQLVLKKYINIGVAADTPEGLVVPVIKAADAKNVSEIAEEMAQLAAEARKGRLSPQSMQGATFTISSLGGIGGTNFTPIINAPEVAILGMTRATIQPVWDGEGFRPRLIQPVSLSWDHRVVDGVAAARFLVHLKSLLADFRRISL